MKKKSAFRIKKTWQAVIYGIIFALIVSSVVVCLLAGLLVKFDIPSEYVKFLWFVPAVLAGVISGGVTGKHVRAKGFLWGSVASLSAGCICLLILLFVNFFSIDIISYLILPVFAVAGSAGGIISSNLK